MNKIIFNLEDKSEQIKVPYENSLFELGFTVDTSRKIAEEIVSCPVGLNDWQILEVGH